MMIALRVRDVYVLDMTSSAQESCFFAKDTENLNWLWYKKLPHLNFKTINQLAKQNLVIGLPSLVYSKDKPCSSCEKSIIVKRHLKNPYEIFCGRHPNIDFLHVFGFLVFIHNHKDHLGKFNEKANDGYFLGYSLVSKAFKVFNTRRQQTEETYHITFDESIDAIKFTKPLVDNITIAKSERYPPDKYLHPYEPSQRYRVNSNDVSFIEPYEIRNPRARMLTRAMAKELSAASAHECLFVDFLSKEEPKKVSKELQHPGWVDVMQEELN
ncbi:retrovirus-related pol polyprotein from transposon TNT 1-94 [Tanacetum coccineum]